MILGLYPELNVFLKSHSQVVQDEIIFNWWDVILGVPQGSVLGPLLFLLYNNDLPQNISSDCRLFADNVLLYNIRKNYQDLEKANGPCEFFKIGQDTGETTT